MDIQIILLIIWLIAGVSTMIAKPNRITYGMMWIALIIEIVKNLK